ncbi:hypothetical protein [Halomonas tibetensis]|uniref:Uncharacterized protein n=1 Tax=Halomonas tibetensis TaxID=2259590 RepID=A0ABV7B6C8_9GAMM
MQIVMGEYVSRPPSAGSAQVCSPNLWQLLVIGCHQLQRLEVSPEAERLESLCIDHAPGLEDVILQRKLVHAGFRHTLRPPTLINVYCFNKYIVLFLRGSSNTKNHKKLVLYCRTS